MSEKTTHCDIGISPQIAFAMATKPTIDFLCNRYDGGGSIRDSLACIELYGDLPAAVNCPYCQRVAGNLRNGYGLDAARRM